MVRDSILHSIQAISAGGQGENLLIHGSVQVGKTTLAALAGRECRNARIGVYFTPIRFYLDELKEEMKHEVERSVKQIALYAPVLIIDDLGAENGSKWEIGEIFDLIEGRLCKGLTTIITSNNSPAALRKKWKTAATDPEVQDQGGRIAERLLKHFVSVEVLN
jgi:DNA replication protein DnaC